MTTWPLIQRNKVEDSQVNIPVETCAESDNEGLSTLAKKVFSLSAGRPRADTVSSSY